MGQVGLASKIQKFDITSSDLYGDQSSIHCFSWKMGVLFIIICVLEFL